VISFRDTMTLAGAKLHSKRIMLGISVVVSGLLFGILFGASLLVTGISKSAHAYTRTALDGQYLVKSTPVIPPGVLGADSYNLGKETIAELTSLQTDFIARQKALAKKLGVGFDEKAVAPILAPDPYADASLPAEKRVRINFESPIYQEYLEKLQIDYAKVAKNKLSDLEAAAAPYGAKGFHQNQQAALSFTNALYLPKGKEDPSKFGPSAHPQNSDLSEYGYLTTSVRNSTYSLVDDSLIKRFILPANDTRQSNTAAIPVVITTTEAVALFGPQMGVSEKPTGAAQQIAWMKNLQQKINGLTYTVCYRNDTEIQQLTKIARDASEVEEHKNDKEYAKPTLAYSLPAGTCGGITTKQDTRTAAEKKAEQDQIALDKALGTYEAPRHQLLTFTVVGVMPVSPQSNAMTSLPGFVSSLLGAQYGAGAMIPKQMFDGLPENTRRENALLTEGKQFIRNEMRDAGIGETIVAFPSVAQARSFIQQQGCPPIETSCKRSFTLEPYGSNYLLVDDIDATAAKALRTALPIALAIAGIIIWATMARVIIDSRRETAVFRAIGAKRRDIMAIYLLYSVIVALRIAGFSLVLGAGIAALIQALYGGQMTNYAKVAYGVFDKGQTFNVIGINVAQLALLVVCIFGISLVAVLPPLVRNIRRSPISDMRDE
jgi:hypothetical protein